MRKGFSTAACAVLLCAAPAQGAESADRAAIGALVDSLHAALRKGDDARVAALFAGDGQRPRLANPALRRPMSEVAGPFARIESLRMPAPSVAVAVLEVSFYGSLISKDSRRVILIARKQAGAWRADSYWPVSCWPGGLSAPLNAAP